MKSFGSTLRSCLCLLLAPALLLLSPSGWTQGEAEGTAAGGVQVFRDPVTGELREPTAEELSPPGRARLESPGLPAPQPQVTTLGDGTLVYQPGPGQRHYAQARRGSEGQLDLRCDVKTPAADN